MGGPAVELKLLGCAILVGVVQLIWAAGAARRQQNMQWASGPRDESMPLTGVAGRLDRAFKNYMETFPLFAAAVIAVYLAAKLGPLTVWGCGLYVAARAIYPAIYAAGIPLLRTVVWGVSLAGFLMVVAALFL